MPKVDEKVWRDESFRALSDDAKLLWLYLLTNPHRSKCPGLLVVSELAMAEDLCWIEEGEAAESGLARLRSAMDEIRQQGWAVMEKRLVWLPKAVLHNPPANHNVVISWVAPFKALPKVAMREQWIVETAKTLARMMGEDDRRVLEFKRMFCNASGEPSQLTLGGVDSDSPPVKQEDAPQWFTARQREVWNILKSAIFFVPGEGERTAWQTCEDPVKLAMILGGDIYNKVSTDTIQKLADWTRVNRAKAKKSVDVFLHRTFARAQREAEVTANGRTSAYPHEHDLYDEIHGDD